MDERYTYLIDMIKENGPDYVLQFFNDDYDTLFKFLTRKKLWDYIDISSFDDTNSVYGYLLANGYEDKVIQDVIKNMSSVSYDGTNYFYEVRDLEELVDWFKEYSRDVSPNDVAKGILSEDDWEPFSFSRRDVNLMRDVYDNLSEENKKTLRDIIVERYGNKKFEIPRKKVTDVIEEYGIKLENGNYEIKVNVENILHLFSDDDLMNYLFDTNFYEEGSDLFSLYNFSYNDAYYVIYKDKVWDELKGYFLDSDAEVVHFEFGKRNYIKLKITNVLPKRIKEYIFSDYCEDINNLGSYDYLISTGFDCDTWERLSFTIHDWPDSSKVKEIMNTNFNSYF
jgi:hypothetical protein